MCNKSVSYTIWALIAVLLIGLINLIFYGLYNNKNIPNSVIACIVIINLVLILNCAMSIRGCILALRGENDREYHVCCGPWSNQEDGWARSFPTKTVNI